MFLFSLLLSAQTLLTKLDGSLIVINGLLTSLYLLHQIKSQTESSMSTVEQAVAKERESIRFNPLKLSQFLYGQKQYEELRRVLDTYKTTPYDFNIYNKGRVEILKQAMRDLPVVYNTLNSELSEANMTYLVLNSMNQTPGSVHVGMFIKCIQIMGTDDQQKKYLEKCRNYEILGCYAQTEMGHGSDVSSLMTTATFIEEKDEFILNNSHDIKAIKYWPGEMGIIATHALVFAQLIVKGKNHGVHAFLCQIRDQNLKPMPGVEVGDIGPKIGFFSKDNGYLILNNVSIPRKNMLRRFMSVSQKGEIKIKGDPKVSYATMMEIRRYISCLYPKLYACAITIATKYSLFRRQFKNAAKEEIKIMDYQLQQEKILDRIAQYFAITVAGNNIRKISSLNSKIVQEKEDFSLMAETHACLCLGKPFFSELVYDGMQICRKACGGQGFSQYSGFPSLINQYACHLTHQGQNTVLYLQVARYLMKSYKGFMVKKQTLDKSVKYIESFEYLMGKKCEVADVNQWNLEDIRILIGQSVCYLLSVAAEKIIAKEEGVSEKDVINKMAGLNLRDIGYMHAGYYTFDSFKQAIAKEKNEQVKEITTNLCMLFGLNFVLRNINPAAQAGFISAQQTTLLNQLKEELLRKLRPDIIGIVDGFGIPDRYVRSALTYGNPYQNFLKLARENEINHQRMPSVDIVKTVKNYIKNPNAAL